MSDSDFDTCSIFKDDEAKARYEAIIKERPFHIEFAIRKEPNFGLTPEVAQIITQHNWKKFAAHPCNPCVPLVREFYANITSTELRHSMVGWTKVSFSAKSINMSWGFRKEEDEYQDLLKEISEVELDAMVKELTVEGIVWLNDARENTWKIARPALNPLAKVWYHFVRHRLLPTTHLETVDKDRLVLLGCILGGKKVNVGLIIEKQISECVFKGKNRLYFSSLITELFMMNGVEMKEGDEIIVNKGILDVNAIKRFAASKTTTQQAQSSKV